MSGSKSNSSYIAVVFQRKRAGHRLNIYHLSLRALSDALLPYYSLSYSVFLGVTSCIPVRKANIALPGTINVSPCHKWRADYAACSMYVVHVSVIALGLWHLFLPIRTFPSACVDLMLDSQPCIHIILHPPLSPRLHTTLFITLNSISGLISYLYPMYQVVEQWLIDHVAAPHCYPKMSRMHLHASKLRETSIIESYACQMF